MSEADPVMPTPAEELYREAVEAQRRASDPSATRLASANAGSGKTHVLVGRVSRLLLTGVAPEHILCLTYTKAAAAEMQSRLFRTLGDWSVMDDEKLTAELRGLVGDAPLPALPTARGLFARALETPEGLKVQTIHSFCAEVLSRFPMEAGILPGFEPVDDAEAAAVQATVRERILHDAYYEPRGELAAHLHALAGRKADRTLDELFTWMGGQSRRIELFTDRDGLVEIAELLGIECETDAEAEARRAWEETDADALRALLPEIPGGGAARERDIAAAVEDALVLSAEDPAAAWHRYTDAFLTKSGAARASVTTAKATEAVRAFFGKKGEPSDEEARVLRVQARIRSAELMDEAATLATIARDYVEKYRAAKRERRVLDYSDQVQLVHDLLQVSEARDWVRYKLDGGIHHILIDEAQDTSDLQWGIIDALRESFDPPDERGTQAKTFFAVGDEKQSIYSFQGAQPQSFIGRINAGGADAVRMRMSFRSAPEILRVVDAVFEGVGEGETGARASMFETAVEGAAGEGAHTAHRSDRGRVELWPVAPRPDEAPDEVAWDPRPLDQLDLTHPKERLAGEIAGTVARWLSGGEPVHDRELGRTRPMRPEDVLILVRSRGDFFDAVIRHLKGAGVPVAGADRLTLGEAVVVKDLLSLARFALFPGDDLSLAEVLKSPLLGYSEDDLFRVAHIGEGGRGDRTLWQSLLASGHDLDKAAAELLGGMVSGVLDHSPYAFFATALDARFGGQTLRHRIERRLGVESRDPLSEFLGQVIAYQRRASGSLQHFVAEFARSTVELKREQGGPASEVRIMTVHGAKGLEAPVVILPQTTSRPRTDIRGGMLEVGDGFVPAGSKGSTPPALEPYRKAQEDAAMQEHLRLLYVAMTRAESRLVVCGVPYTSKTDAHEHSWYEEIRRGMQGLGAEAMDTPFGEGLVHGGAPEPVAGDDARDDAALVDLPPWLDALVEAEARSERRVTPSHLLDDSHGEHGPPPVRSPLSRTAQMERERRFLRGTLIHKLLELLPDIAPARRAEVAGRILAAHRLPDAFRKDVTGEALRVLDAFPDVFAPGSQAEVSLAGSAAGLPADMRLNAQIDRLSVTDTHVFIVDYKSNRPPPETQDGVSAQYLGQMAAYRELAREMWPDREVRCGLLWTDAARMMILDDARLDAALERIRGL